MEAGLATKRRGRPRDHRYTVAEAMEAVARVFDGRAEFEGTRTTSDAVGLVFDDPATLRDMLAFRFPGQDGLPNADLALGMVVGILMAEARNGGEVVPNAL
jgi:hypothetical protein